jgi:hypothetical protein
MANWILKIAVDRVVQYAGEGGDLARRIFIRRSPVEVREREPHWTSNLK